MDPEPPSDPLQPFGRSQLQFLALDHAWAGDQENGLVEPDVASK
jgi:hypothetical protein